ncbi:MAG: lipid-A-disaccharide synthase [Candidatus Obscuribacterales bacterium]|nr:lipid-A-disaccharide synthase [Candidatus Obscuribacterales bacterium]
MNERREGKKSLFICVGDVSADRHAGKLITTLKKAVPDLDIWGVGCSSMEAAGARILYNRESMAVIGGVEVLRYLPKLIAMRQDLLNRIRNEKPDALLLMDFGGFNVGFATEIRKYLKDVPIIYFISPQVWGSRPWRINAIAAAVSKMLVIFPFEEPLYKRKGVNARFVGHPLTLKFKPEQERMSKEDFCKLHGLDPQRPIIGIFPGSRKQEIRCHSHAVLGAIDWLSKERPDLQFVIATANQGMADALQFEIEKLGYVSLINKSIKTISSDYNEELMTHSELLWTKSGTTTLEATLIGKPMLLFYQGAWISFLLVLLLKTVKYIGWPNLLHGEGIIPELIQLDCRAEQLVKYTRDWLDVPGLRKEISAELKELKRHLGEGDFTNNAAREILETMGLSPETDLSLESLSKS